MAGCSTGSHSAQVIVATAGSQSATWATRASGSVGTLLRNRSSPGKRSDLPGAGESGGESLKSSAVLGGIESCPFQAGIPPPGCRQIR